ncbi:hypothetical protein AVEN_264422-1 [Araneus ventricosus]|uniref:Uncharacterized protein n=1 Tax=Araneus ventricosus TaxID=182803 RepID=A0A4Y2HTR5_ARAVE|nr:hypothetical protein AVEN_264422-1 [Araneus ventricosus]
MEEMASPPKTTAPSEPKLPFSKNNLPKKNDPVDVEKAFGKDRSFPPRPPTPPELEDTVSAEETEKALAELEPMSNVAFDSQLAKIVNTTATSLLGDMTSSDRAFLPISDLESEAQKLDLHLILKLFQQQHRQLKQWKSKSFKESKKIRKIL